MEKEGAKVTQDAQDRVENRRITARWFLPDVFIRRWIVFRNLSDGVEVQNSHHRKPELGERRVYIVD